MLCLALRLLLRLLVAPQRKVRIAYPFSHTHAHTLAEILEDYINESVSGVSKYLNELYGRSVLI